MIVVESQRAEGARYAACLVLVPGLWAGPSAWRPFAGYLGHRGWECHLVDLRAVRGGIDARAATVAEYVRTLAAPSVLVGHDAGALVALGAARRGPAAAVVLVSPLVPGSRGARALALGGRTLLRLAFGRPIPPPRGGASARAWRGGAQEGAADLHDDDAAAVRDLVRARPALVAAPGVPGLVLGGEDDPLLPAADAAHLARAIGAEHRVLPGVGHWPLAGRGWLRTADAVHRWVVQRLGAPLLDLYEEAMAERDDAADDSD